MRKIRLERNAPGRISERFALDLNESRRLAVDASDGYNPILAGPGTGETRVITYRVACPIARGWTPARSCR